MIDSHACTQHTHIHISTGLHRGHLAGVEHATRTDCLNHEADRARPNTPSSPGICKRVCNKTNQGFPRPGVLPSAAGERECVYMYICMYICMLLCVCLCMFLQANADYSMLKETERVCR